MKAKVGCLLVAFVVVCGAQTISMSGVVKNSAGAGIAGAAVRLGQAGISTTSGADGSFTLVGGSAILPRRGNYSSGSGLFRVLRDGSISFFGSRKGTARVQIFNGNGRLELTRSHTITPGTTICRLPRTAHGVHLYQVHIGDKLYTAHCFSGTSTISNEGTGIIQGQTQTLSKTTTQFNDVVIATKTGFQLSRSSVANPTATGLQLTLIPWVTGAVTDTEGHEYKTIKYGTQEWTVENVRIGKYNDGVSIPNVTDNVAWNSPTSGGYCFYNNSTDTAEQHKWGAMYNWTTATNPKFAPKGWRLPTFDDWNKLMGYFQSNGYDFGGDTNSQNIAKGLASTTDWVADTAPMTCGNNQLTNNYSGFSGLPAGYRINDGTYDGRGKSTYWWMNQEGDPGSATAWFRRLSNVESTVFQYITSQGIGCSVRLVRDVN